jgi:ribonuclease-3
MNLSKLEKIIGYTFIDDTLLEQALIHASCSIMEDGQPFNNERMEFLGDRILNFCVSNVLYHKFPDESEGALSKRHASLVQQATLAKVAKEMGLGEFLSLGKGEESSGGRQKPSILSDAVEALTAAIYLDSNMESAQKFVEKFIPDEVNADLLKDPKSRLQEWLQSHKQPLPTYKILTTSGKAHARTFKIEVVTQSHGTAVGKGETKRQAQQNAAKELLQKIEKHS